MHKVGVANKTRHHEIKSPWLTEASSIDFIKCDTFGDSLVEEAILIRDFQPKYNKDGDGMAEKQFKLFDVFDEILDKLLGIKRPKPQPKISLLIPFTSKSKQRNKTFKWLLEYWKHELPDAEIVIGKNNGRPFCKTAALNDAAEKATGKILVIVDADTYMPGSIIEFCADRILEELEAGEKLWYVPYRHLYRLNKLATSLVLASDPTNPFRFTSPPQDIYIDDDGKKSGYGHRYGAMIMIFPREALDAIGCFDERFRGWGGEDVALLRALDTLYAKHKTTNNDVLHLWHPTIGHNYKSRVWQNQREQYNNNLANKYHKATRHPSKMKELVEEGCKVHEKRKKRKIKNPLTKKK